MANAFTGAVSSIFNAGKNAVQFTLSGGAGIGSKLVNPERVSDVVSRASTVAGKTFTVANSASRASANTVGNVLKSPFIFAGAVGQQIQLGANITKTIAPKLIPNFSPSGISIRGVLGFAEDTINNTFGTLERGKNLFTSAQERVQKLFNLKSVADDNTGRAVPGLTIDSFFSDLFKFGARNTEPTSGFMPNFPTLQFLPGSAPASPEMTPPFNFTPILLIAGAVLLFVFIAKRA